MTKATNGLLAAYAMPALPLAAIALPVYIIVPTFYADRFGLSLAGIGAVLLLIRLIDAITDPLFGVLSDRVHSRFGRRRFFFALSLPLTALAALMLFWPPADADLLYLALWGILLSIGTTWTTLPYTAWGAELLPGYHDRARLTAWREGVTLLGTLIAISVPFAIGLERVDGQGQAGGLFGVDGLASLGILVAGLLPLLGLLAVWRVPEPIDRSQRRLTLRDSAGFLWRNMPFRRLVLSFLLNSFANAIPASLFLLFVANRLGAESLQGPLLFLYFLSAIAGVPLAVIVSRRIGKHRAWSISMLLAFAIFLPAGFLGEGDIVAFGVICVGTGLLLGFDLALPPAIQADVVDHDTATSGEQRSGLYFAAWGLVSKLSLALSAGIVFPLLEFSGFDTSRPDGQTATALASLSALYAWAPILPKLLAIAVMWNFTLDEQEHARIQRKLETSNSK